MLAGSRILYGMAVHGHAPKIFTKVNRFGIPFVAVSLYGLFMCLGFMTLSDSASTVFTWLQDLVSIATLVNWIVICIVYLRFMQGCKRQGIDRHTELPWAAPFQPYTTYASLTLFIILLFTGGWSTFVHRQWSTETFVSSYLNIPLILALYFGAKFWFKTKLVTLDNMPIRHFIAIWRENPEPEDPARVGWAKFNFLW